MRKYICEECDWHGTNKDVLEAPNPFSEDGTDTMLGCPDCREPNTMHLACDEPDCWLESSCGTPTPNGYRRVCGDHYRALSVMKESQ